MFPLLHRLDRDDQPHDFRASQLAAGMVKQAGQQHAFERQWPGEQFTKAKRHTFPAAVGVRNGPALQLLHP